MRFRSNQRWSSSPKNNIYVLFLHLILLHDINDIIVFSYEFISFILVCLLQTFMKESSVFFVQNVLLLEAEKVKKILN